MRLLAPVSALYGFGALVRAVAYDTGYLRAGRIDQPVISVGNVTLGGTGKTPIVATIAAFVRDQGYEVAVLTRGYGRTSNERIVLRSEDGRLEDDAVAQGGDEPVLLARELPGVPIVVDANREAAARWAAAELGSEVFLLDDGFQHLQLARDANLLVLDATDPFGGLRLPPLGRLREPLQGMRRADAVVVTRADRAFDEAMIERVVRGTCRPEIPILYTWHDVESVRALGTGEVQSPQVFRGRKVAVLTGIGNPDVFVSDLANLGMHVVSESLMSDHHRFTEEDVATAVAAARTAGAEALLVTEKDAVKIERLHVPDFPVFVVRIAFRSDEEGQLMSVVMKAVLRRVPN